MFKFDPSLPRCPASHRHLALCACVPLPSVNDMHSWRQGEAAPQVPGSKLQETALKYSVPYCKPVYTAKQTVRMNTHYICTVWPLSLWFSIAGL